MRVSQAREYTKARWRIEQKAVAKLEDAGCPYAERCTIIEYMAWAWTSGVRWERRRKAKALGSNAGGEGRNPAAERTA